MHHDTSTPTRLRQRLRVMQINVEPLNAGLRRRLGIGVRIVWRFVRWQSAGTHLRHHAPASLAKGQRRRQAKTTACA